MSAATDQSIPTVSRVFDDGTLVELVYDATAASTALAVCHPDGHTERVDTYLAPTGERLIPYSAQNNLLTTGCVLLPSDIGEFRDKRDVVEDIRAFLHRYVDLPDVIEEIAAYYVLLSWVHDAFNELPYLRFRGTWGSGKTRALLSVGSLCYKPFFASGASTVSPIFHILDAFQGTMILDEADFRFSDATSELTKVLNNGNMQGLPVLRTMTNRHKELNPTAFRVFGPKVVAMRESFADQALESRFLTHDTGGRPLRADIPIHMPASLRTEALALRNTLLAWRFHARRTVAPDPTRLITGVSPRTNQTVLALLSLVDDEGLRGRIAAELQGEEAVRRDERQTAPDATMVGVLLDAFQVATTPSVSIEEITHIFNRKTSERFELPMSNKWVGWFLRTRLGLVTSKSRGVYVVAQTERPKINALAQKLGCLTETPVNADVA